LAKIRWIAFVGLWLAFCGCGLWLHHACKGAAVNQLGWTDIAGYDSEAYVTHFTSPLGILEVNHRHPLAAVVSSPITAVGLMVSYRAEREFGYQAVICCFGLIGACCCLLLWQVLKKAREADAGKTGALRLAALALWLSFSHVWLLAGLAEYFGISLAILLGVLLMVLYDVRDARAWLGASALAGGVTVTNFIKPLAAWLVAADGVSCLRRLRRRTVVLGLAAAAGGLAVAALALMGKWAFLDGISVAKGVEGTVRQITDCLPAGVSLSRRLWLVWNAFWCEPMLLRESVIAQSGMLHPYPSLIPHLLAAAVLALCVWSAVRNFRLPVVRAALAMVVFDVLLHVVVGWGLAEGQIYCGHWFWIIPLLVSLLPPRTAFLTFALAAAIALNNLGVVFG